MPIPGAPPLFRAFIIPGNFRCSAAKLPALLVRLLSSGCERLSHRPLISHLKALESIISGPVGQWSRTAPPVRPGRVLWRFLRAFILVLLSLLCCESSPSPCTWGHRLIAAGAEVLRFTFSARMGLSLPAGPGKLLGRVLSLAQNSFLGSP